jgi:hypothetical protein
MSPCGIGLTHLPLGKDFTIIFQWNIEKAHIADMIENIILSGAQNIDIGWVQER